MSEVGSEEHKTVLDKIYDRFKEMKKEAVSDCLFERDKLDTSYNNTNKIIKWINRKSEWQKVLRDLENERKEVYKKVYEFYKTDYPRQLAKEENSIFIESDPTYIDIFTKTQVAKEVVLYIDSVLETLKGRAWEIKGYLEYLKFKNGII